MSRHHIEHLAQELYSSSERRRRKAAEALRQLGEPGGRVSLESFITMMLHDTTPLRVAAADILREWREYVPLEPLFLAMQDTNERVRSAAQWALVDIGTYAPQEALLPHLTDPDATVREAVLRALGKRAPVAVVLETLEAPEQGLCEAATYLIGLLGEHVPVETLINMLQRKETHIRVAAARLLGNIEQHIPLEPLIEALHDPEKNVRLEAIWALANAGERMPQAALRALLDDADPLIQREATKALASVGDPAALSIIVGWLHVDHEWARENALVWLRTPLGAVRNGIARRLPVEELLHLLKDAWWPVGYMAAGMIATLGEDAPFAELLELLSDPLPQTRQAALHALVFLGDDIPLSQYIPIESVLIALETEESETRRRAAEVLSYFDVSVPVERLLPRLDDENVELAGLIARQGRQEGIDILVANLRTRFRVDHALVVLGELGERVPAEPLLAELHTSDASVRQGMAATLYETHPEQLPHLAPELVETLCTGKVGPLLEPLQDILIAQALAALRSSHPTLLAWFDQTLASPYWEVRMWAIIGSSQMAPHVLETTIGKLQRLLDDPEAASVREAALGALETIALRAATDGYRG
ncbi:HEAT repeat domain-containing protein [Dictyobacter formicarum]|uniref:HEAT repeat domain-containing protein n=1 Tax=Dictyobacter formicarum TaxID=2778368 RepID=A0ABQ3VTF1_9CHLR|nr:HEAT repeat domain-containing protein [Dictyobacter formicarum]GHO89152.1 hypothetical protein KSZ_71580 [Dictyobacter formicarum]